jgi:transposase
MTKKLTNLYTPRHSDRFSFADASSANLDTLWVNHDEGDIEDDPEVPHGLIDWARVNRNYKVLLEKLSIREWTKANIIKLFDRKNGSDPCIESGSTLNPEEVETDIAYSIFCQRLTEPKVQKAIHLIQIEKLTEKAICAILCIKLSELKDLQRFVIRQLRKEKALRTKFYRRRPRKVTEAHITVIMSYWNEHQGQRITIPKIQNELIESHPMLQKISRWTIAEIMKNRLGFSYKKSN